MEFSSNEMSPITHRGGRRTSRSDFGYREGTLSMVEVGHCQIMGGDLEPAVRNNGALNSNRLEPDPKCGLVLFQTFRRGGIIGFL